MHLFPLGKKHAHLLVLIYTYTHVQEVALSVKQEDSFTLLIDLCLTCVFALVSFIFTTRIICTSQHISKDCYVDSLLTPCTEM